MSQKRFEIIYPSQVKRQNERNPVNDLRKVLSIAPTRSLKSPKAQDVKLAKGFSKKEEAKKLEETPKPLSQSPPQIRMDVKGKTEYEIEEEKTKRRLQRLQASKKNYIFRYDHLNYKTLKYSVDKVFKKKQDHENASKYADLRSLDLADVKDGIKEIFMKKFMKRGQSKGPTSYDLIDNPQGIPAPGRKSLDHSFEEEKKNTLFALVT